MKLRSGFVSNSSTSSFIAIGYDFDSIKEELVKSGKIKSEGRAWEQLRASGLVDEYESDKAKLDMIGDGSYVLGRKLESWSDDSGFVECGFDMTKLAEVSKFVQESLGLSYPPKLLVGTYAS